MPPRLAAWLAPFCDGFAAAVWPRVLVLIAGAVLAPGQRTVSAALRVMGLWRIGRAWAATTTAFRM